MSKGGESVQPIINCPFNEMNRNTRGPRHVMSCHNHVPNGLAENYNLLTARCKFTINVLVRKML